MRLSPIFAAACALALGATMAGVAAAADATPTFAAFKQLCLAPQAHTQRILAQADAAGWAPGPAAMASAPQFKAMAEFGVRVRTDGAAQTILIVGSGPVGEFGGQKISADLCLLSAKGVDGAAVAGEVGAWVGVPADPKHSTPGNATYSYAEDDRGRVAVINPSDEEAKALVKAGKVHLVFVQFADDQAMVGYFTPRP